MSNDLTLRELYEQGLAALELAEFEDAIEMFGRAAVEDSSDPRVWFYLGLCYLETGQTDFAIEALNRAITADERFADAHYLLGTAVGATGQLDGAARSYRRALEIEPNHQKAEEFLIRTEALLASREHYRKAVGIIHAQEREPGWLNAAVRELLHSIAIFNESPARRDLAQLAAEIIQSGNRRIVADLTAIDGPFWGSALRRAQDAFTRKRWPEAAAAYHEALDLSHDHAFIHHALGLIYFALGDGETAVRSWQRALDLDAELDFGSAGFIGD